jgi:hypothetical protein
MKSSDKMFGASRFSRRLPDNELTRIKVPLTSLSGHGAALDAYRPGVGRTRRGML